jgi:spermidine/putrescine-binding protein
MTARDLVARYRDGSLSRRDFNKAAAAFGVSMMTVPVGRNALAADDKPMYFGWAGYDDPNFIQPYIDAHGAPNYTFWGSEDEAFQKMRTGGFQPDVMAPCTYELVKWKDAGLLASLDPSRLEYVNDMFPSLENIEGSIIDGERYFMPMDWGNSTIIYRRDLVGEAWSDENVSWKIFYTDEFKNRLGFYDSAGAIVEISALVLGYDNIFTLTDEQLVEVRKAVEVQRDNMRMYWADQTSAVQALASGELVASYGWNDAYVTLKSQGYDVGLGVPKEGIFTWCCGLVMHAETEYVDEAYDMINAFSSPEAGAYEISNWGYGHSNMKAFDLVADDVLAELGLSTPEALLGSGIFFQALAPEIEEKYIRLWDEVAAGY